MTDSLTVFGTDYTGVTGIKATGTGNGTLTYIRPQGNLAITQNTASGSTLDVAQYATATVNVPSSGSDAFIVTVSYNEGTEKWTPNKTFSEIVAAYNADREIAVTSDFPDSAYADGYYDGEGAFRYCVAENGHDDVADVFTNTVTYYVFTASSLSIDDSVVYTEGGGIPTLQSKSATPTESAQTIEPDSGYDGLSSVTVGAISSTYVGSGIDRNDSTDLTASGATVSVPAGYYASAASKAVSSGTEGTPTATKGTVSNHAISVTPSVMNSAGYIAGGTKTGTAVSVSASELVSGTYTVDSSGTKDVTNYASASVPAGTAGTPSASKGTVSNHAISVTPSVTNSTGWITGGTKSGTAVSVSASELVSGTYTVDSSGTKDVTNYASASVPAGTAGTPSASKGAVSNHSVSVTPSVTNQTGWIVGSTKTGTAVTVSASELVSGSETKTANGTYDVTNLAELVVNITYSTIYTGTGNPSASQGSNGDVYLKTVS